MTRVEVMAIEELGSPWRYKLFFAFVSVSMQVLKVGRMVFDEHEGG